MIKPITSTAPTGKSILAIFAFVFVVMLLISKDSYMHDMPNHNDSAWFFMCGKAWASGLTPYVDFADSKGPLLWLIYAMGYMLTPHSYVGVFWLSLVAWTATLCLSLRSATLFAGSRSAAYIAMLAVAMAGLQPLFHNETRCEDFAMPFVAFVVYAICNAAKRERWSWGTGMGVGVSIAATALMKYNIAMMLTPLALTAWIVARRQRVASPTLCALQAVCGATLLMAPFIAYFLANGCLLNFLHEYFVVTLKTTANAAPLTSTMQSLTSTSGICATLVFAVSAVSMAHLMPRHRLLALLCNALFFALCAINSRPYYFTIYSPLAIFVGIVLAKACKKQHERRAAWGAATAVGILLIVSNLAIHDFRHADYGDFFTQDNAARHDFYAIEHIVAKVPGARVVSIVYVGVGICSDALPACKYWASQTGATPKMRRQQIEACTRGIADFALVPPECTDIVAELKRAGWHTYDFSQGPYGILLMSKRWLGDKPTKCDVSNMDVLLKRDVGQSMIMNGAQ